MDPSVLLNDSGELVVTGEVLLDSDVDERSHEGNCDGGTKLPIKTCLFRFKTHNEKLVVVTCGFLLARKIFYKCQP